MLIDLGNGQNRLGCSALAQTCKQTGDVPPDLDDAEQLKSLFNVFQQLNSEGKILAWHDRSDGGLLTAVAEMLFAGRVGVELDLSSLGEDVLAALFNEELGAVLPVLLHSLRPMYPANSAGPEQSEAPFV